MWRFYLCDPGPHIAPIQILANPSRQAPEIDPISPMAADVGG